MLAVDTWGGAGGGAADAHCEDGEGGDGGWETGTRAPPEGPGEVHAHC